jgi:hypothetical protein
MSIIDPHLVNIEIAPHPEDGRSVLRLNYHQQIYDLVRVFASHKIERAEQKLQQAISILEGFANESSGDRVNQSTTDRYILVGEVGYYSLWKLDLTLNSASCNWKSKREAEVLELQQASIWLFQELWLQWQDLLGDKQLEVFTEDLLTVIPQIQSGVDLDRLLAIEPLGTARLAAWSAIDLIKFDRQLYHLTQKKIGRQFGTELTIEIIQTMPERLRSTLIYILDI